MQEVRKKPPTAQEFLVFLSENGAIAPGEIPEPEKTKQPPKDAGAGGALFLLGENDEPQALALLGKGSQAFSQRPLPKPDQQLFYLDLPAELVDWVGFFDQLGQWWQTGEPRLPCIWIANPRFLPAQKESQEGFFLARPQLWRSWASTLPQNFGNQSIRWIPERLSGIPKSGWSTARLGDRELMLLDRSIQNLSLTPTGKEFPQGSWGLHWKMEYRGIHIPVFQPLGTSLPAILQKHWKAVLEKIHSAQFSLGGKNLMRQLPWVSTLIFFLGEQDALLVLDHLRRSKEFTGNPGLSKLFFYNLRAKGKISVLATPYCSPKRINHLLPPLARIRPLNWLGDQENCRKINREALEALARNIRTRSLSLSPQGSSLLKGLLDSYSQFLSQRIDLLARKGLPVGRFLSLDNFMKQLVLHRLSDRQIILCFLDQGGDFWRQMRFWVSGGRAARLSEERESVKNALLREEYLLDDRWEAIMKLITILRDF